MPPLIWTKTFIVIYFLSVIVPVLVNVAFVTLLERKILGLSQIRLGPNKVSLAGLTQPFSDAIKLLSKQMEFNTNMSIKMFYGSPVMMFILVVMLWMIMPIKFMSAHWSLGFLLFVTILSMTVYPLFITGWASNSKYSTIGAIRSIAQTISYEISLSLIIMCMIVAMSSFQFVATYYSPPMMLISPLIGALWFIMSVAETNRTPFDFSEGESELVSGFNIEYASVGFVLIFLSEYASIIMFSSLSASLLMSCTLFSAKSALLSVLFSALWILLRSTYPRYRYDLLMGLAWKSFLPYSIGLLMMLAACLSL